MGRDTPADYAAFYKQLAGKNLSTNPIEKYRSVIGLDRGILDALPSVLPSIEFLVEKLDELLRGIVRAVTGVVGGGLANLEEWVLGIPVLGDILAIIKKVITGEGDIELPPIMQGASNFLRNLERMLGQLIDIFNGVVVTPINNAIAGVVEWFAGLLGFRKNTSEKVTAVENDVNNQGTIVQGVQRDVETISDDLVDKAQIGDLPNNIPMWQTANPLEDPSFPRIMLNKNPKWVNTRTEDGGGGTHWHGVAVRTDPFYQPSKGVMELAFIRIPRNRKYNTVGIIVGAQTNPCPLYLAVYQMDNSGSLDIIWPSRDISSLINPGNKSEVRIDMDFSQLAEGGQYFAVGVLQAGSGNVRDLAGVEMDSISAPVGVFPPKANAISQGGLTSPPERVTSGQLNFNASTWIPWACLGQKLEEGAKKRLYYRDLFDRPNGPLGVDWAVRGEISVVNGCATTVTNGQSSALWVQPLNYDDHAVSATIGTSTANLSLLTLRGNNIFTRGLCFAFSNAYAALYRCVGVNQYEEIPGTALGYGLPTGTRIELSAIGNTYVVTLDGTERLAWTDVNNTVPTGPGYRFVGTGMYRGFFVSSPELREWSARDLPAPSEQAWPGTDVYPSRLSYPSEG